MKWLHTLETIGLGALATLSPALQGIIGTHPVVTSVLTTLWMLLGHFLPSPLITKTAPSSIKFGA